MSSSEKLMNFMHFRKSSTQNGDHHIFLIMTGNAHKESCHKLLSLILVRERGLYIIKLIVAEKLWLLSQLKKKLFDDKPMFCQLVLPLSYLYLWY